MPASEEAVGKPKQLSIGEAIAKAQGVGKVDSPKIVSDAFTDNSVEVLDDAKNLAYRSSIRRGEVVHYTRLMALADYAEMEESLYGFKPEEKVLSSLLRGIGVWHYKHGAAVEEFEIRKHDNAATKVIGA